MDKKGRICYDAGGLFIHTRKGKQMKAFYIGLRGAKLTTCERLRIMISCAATIIYIMGDVMNRTRSLTTGLFLVAALLMQGCGKEEPPKPAPKAEAPPPAPPTVVKIGLGAPLTGPQGHIGIDTRNGTQLAVDDINAAGLTL